MSSVTLKGHLNHLCLQTQHNMDPNRPGGEAPAREKTGDEVWGQSLGHHRWASRATNSADTGASSSQDGFQLGSLTFAEDSPRQSHNSFLDWGHSSVIHDSVPSPALAHSSHTHLHTIYVPDTVLGTEGVVEKDGQRCPRERSTGLHARPVFPNLQNHASLRGFHVNAEGSAWKAGLDPRLNKWSRCFLEVPWYSRQEQGLWS